MLSHSQAKNPTIHVTYQRVWYAPTNVSDIGLNRGKYPSHYQVWNAVRMGAYDMANAVACTGYLPTCLICSLLFTSPTNVFDIGLNRGKYPSHYQVWNAVTMIHIASLLHGLMLSHSQAKNPTIHVTYQRVWYPPTNISDIGLNRGKYPCHW